MTIDIIFKKCLSYFGVKLIKGRHTINVYCGNIFDMLSICTFYLNIRKKTTYFVTKINFSPFPNPLLKTEKLLDLRSSKMYAKDDVFMCNVVVSLFYLFLIHRSPYS